MSEPMPTIPTQSPFTYPNPNPSASPSFTQDDTSESFIPEPTQPMPTFTQTAFSQPAVNYQQVQPNQSIFSQPAVHFQQTQPTQTNQTGQQYPQNPNAKEMFVSADYVPAGLDVKSAFLYGEIEEEVYVTQPKGFEDPYFPKHVYRVVKALYGLHQAPRAWYARLSAFLLQHNYRRGTIDKTLFIKKDSRDILLVQVYVDDIIFGSTNKAWCDDFEVLMKGEFEMSAMGEMTFFLGLQVKQLPDGIFISQDKYVKDMLTKFDMESVRTATTPYEAAKTKLKDETDPPVNVHLYRSMIGSLMYLTASRPDIMFAVSACSRHQVTPLTSHLNAVKKIFKYLKGQPKLGLWYPKDSPFQLEAYSDSDYAGSHGDRKSTTGGCQFLGRRLISWQCKKQTIVATSSTEAEYVAAASCCAQVLWIQNQMLDYGFNFMNTKIFIDNQSTICIVKNPVFHQRTKHIEIRHHFIRDANEKNLIQVLKIHTDENVADLLTKAFDGPRFEYLVVHIGMVVYTAAGWAEASHTACYVLNEYFMRPWMSSDSLLDHRSIGVSLMASQNEGYSVGYSILAGKGFRVYNRVTRKVQDCLHVDFLENQENQKGKGPDWMFDLELLTPSMNYIPVRKKRNYVIWRKVSTYDDVEDLDDQQFIVHGPSINAVQNKHSEERIADKEVPLSSEEQALHDELKFLHQLHIIEAIRLFLALGIFHGLLLSFRWMVKSAFLYASSQNVVYKQPPGFEDPAHPNKVYRVVKALYGLHQAPRAWYERLSTFLLKHGYRRGAIDKTLFIKKDRRDIMLVQVYVDDIIFGSTKSSMVKDFEELMQKEFKMSSMGELTFFLGLQVKQTTAGIFLSQDKYVKDILNKFDFRTIKPASTPIEAHKSLGKDEEGEDVDVHLYRSMIGCLMYLTASRPDIMFAVCLCARFQVTPKVSHMHAVKRIFRYLKHQPKLGLWYPKDSPFHLEAFSDSDYAGDNHDRRSTSGGCQYLGRRLVSWQCKKQTIVAISSTEAEYVAAASCCAQVLWMQNQLLDYGFNFMNTEIHIDNESTICIVKNPVLHSKTKHIQIRHHFIRDCYEQRLINVVKVHTDDNVADLLTKGFDLARFNFLVVTIGMMNP
ncbi:putative ribonuclease H-like domain-containing protein [Tanacetum coccineum]